MYIYSLPAFSRGFTRLDKKTIKISLPFQLDDPMRLERWANTFLQCFNYKRNGYITVVLYIIMKYGIIFL